MTTRPASSRFARVALSAVTSVALGVAAHGVAGGAVTGFVPALPLTLLLAFAGTALADRGRRPWAVVATLGVAQFGQHAVLDLVHHGVDGPGLGSGPAAMTAAHVVAVLLTGLLSARADAVLSALVTVVSRLLPPLEPLAPVGAPVPLVPVSSTNTLVTVLLRRVNGRRGPPSS